MALLRNTMRVVSCAAAVAAVLSPGAFAQGFAALVSPPRFELAGKPGEGIRQVVEITNASAQAAKYRIRTADWKFEQDAAVTFDDALRPGSCRPWVALESRQISVSPSGKYRFRFEIGVPADAPAQECRFAILIEGDDQQVQTPGGPAFPIAGRLGVIVYVTVGGAAPDLEVVSTRVSPVNGEDVPVLMVKNSGTAHGRLAGFLSGTDADGKKLEFTTATLPILPGETRAISLVPYREREELVKIAFPITIRGKLEWGDKTTPFEQSFAK
jgi:hypothetical protein